MDTKRRTDQRRKMIQSSGIIVMICLNALFGLTAFTANVAADNVVTAATGDLNITAVQVNANTSLSLTINLTGTGNVTNVNITAPSAFDGGDIWIKDLNIYNASDMTWYYGVGNSTIYGIFGGQMHANITLATSFNSTSPNDKIVVNFSAVAGGIPTLNAMFAIQLFNGTGPGSGPTTLTEDGNLGVDIIDSIFPEIEETTITLATTGEVFNVTANVTDNVDLDTVWLDYNMTSVEGYYNTANVSMTPGVLPSYYREVTIWDNATWFNYTICANDTSDNWNQSIKNVSVNDSLLPEIYDTTTGNPTTGYPFTIMATVTDNIDVVGVNLNYYLNTTIGFTMPLNLSMVNVGGDNYSSSIFIQSNALTLYYNISANDTFNSWNETSEINLNVIDDDSPSSSCFVSGGWYNTPTVPILWTASDNVNLSSVELFYTHSPDNSNWSAPTSFGGQSVSGQTSNGIFNFNWPLGEGYYMFYTIANDSSGNQELPTGSADAIAGYDITTPTIDITSILYASDYIWSDSLTSLYYSDGMGFSGARFVIQGNASDNLSGLSHLTSSEAFGEQPPNDITPDSWDISYNITMIASGTIAITISVYDKAGNIAYDNFTCYEDLSAQNTTMSIGNPKYLGPNSTLYVTTSTHFWLNASTGTTGLDHIEYKIDENPWTIYGGPFTLSSEGFHNIYYRSVDNVSNVEPFQVLNVYVDESPPVTIISIGTPKYGSSPTYVTSTTSFNLTAIDVGVGLKKIWYRTDNGNWVLYSGDFNLSGLADGAHTIYFNGTDMLNNLEILQSIDVYLDNQSPAIDLSVGNPKQGFNPTYVTSSTEFSIQATDYSGSGIHSVEYNVDGGGWEPYVSPFTIDGAGSHDLSYRSIDNLGNTNELEALIFGDDSPPQTDISFDMNITIDGVVYVTLSSQIWLNSTDSGSGVQDTWYSVDGVYWTEYTGQFTVPIGSAMIYYYSVDNLGNIETTKSMSLLMGNGTPIITSEPTTVGYESELYLYAVTAYDSDIVLGDVLRFTLFDYPEGMIINENTGSVSWTPTNNQVGDQDVSIVVSDRTDWNAWQNFTITVINKNTAPYIRNAVSPNYEIVLYAYENLIYSIDAGDDDLIHGDSLTYELHNSPVGMTIDNTGVIRWTPTVDDLRKTYLINISVSDNAGLEVIQSIIVKVPDRPPSLLGGICDRENGTPQDSYSFSITVYDLDGNLPERVYLIIDGEEYDMSHASGGNGTFVYLFEMSLSEGTHAYAFFVESSADNSGTDWRTIEVTQPESVVDWLSVWAVPLLLFFILLMMSYIAWTQRDLISEIRKVKSMQTLPRIQRKSTPGMKLPEPTTPCPKCGTALKPNAQFCGECGSSITNKSGNTNEESNPDSTNGDINEWI